MRNCWLLALLLVGCGSGEDSDGSGGNGFPAGTTCGLSVALSGGVEQTVEGADSVACATQLSSGSGIEAGFLPVGDGPVTMVTIAVDDVEKGKTGAGFPADVRVRDESGTEWHTIECTADISAHTFSKNDGFSDQYQAAGSGTCTGPASSGGAQPNVDVSPFAFVAVIGWTQ
jgi:hypothetical protein